MSASQLRASARQSLQGKWGKGVLIILSYLAIMFLISWVLGIIPVIGPIVNFVISAPISYGIMVSFIKLKRGEKVEYTGFLKEGFSKFGKIWGVYGRIILKLIVPVIFVIVCILIMMYSSFNMALSYESSSIGKGLGLTLIATIVYIVCIIYIAVKGLLYILTNYVLYDNPDMDSKAIVEKSERLMKGNRWKCICLELSFIGWVLLSALTLYIGLLWVVPYMSVALICFYETLAGKNINTEEVIEENNPISE